MKTKTIMLAAVLVLLCMILNGDTVNSKPLCVYFIGNSVTDVVKYGLLKDMAGKAGNEMIWARHMIPGAPLFGMLENSMQGKTVGFTEKPYGGIKEAFTNYEWDVVTLQPFDRRLGGEKGQDERGLFESDVPTVQRHLDLLYKKSPKAQVYIYARWPRIYVNGRGVYYNKDDYDKNIKGITPTGRGVPPVTPDDYQEVWNTKYTGGWGKQLESRDFFEKLVKRVRENNPDAVKPVLIIPVGHVMAELDRQMKSGQIPGYPGGVYTCLYADGIHLNNLGSYVTAATFYAVMFKADPDVLDSTLYKTPKNELTKTINAIIWDVVTEHSMTGVASEEKVK